MQIEIEALDTPIREFSELRRELIEQGRSFDEVTLRAVPYYQLPLCCIGNAGDAACSPYLVRKEKELRRERFLNMEMEEFKEAEVYLKIEQMYDDVMFAIANRIAPKYESLSDCQKLWVKLTCLYNHVDQPSERIQDTISLFHECVDNPEGLLPVDVCQQYAGKLKAVATVYPGKLSDERFREKVSEMADTVLQFMPVEQRALVEKEQLNNFSCTSDCFKVLA